MPSATLLEYCWEMSTLRPRCLSSCSASSALLPAQLPTGIGRRPFETTRSTMVPNRCEVPPLGSEAMTMPSGTVSENAFVDLPKAMLAPRIRSCASSSVIPVSLGSCATARPSETRDRDVGALEDALAGRRVGAHHQPRVDRVGVLGLARLHVEPGVLEPLLRLLRGELQDRGRGGVAGVAEVPRTGADRGGDQEREHQQDRATPAPARPLGRLGRRGRRRDRPGPVGDGRRDALPLDGGGRLARRRQQRGHRGVVPRLRVGVAPRRTLAAEHLGGVGELCGAAGRRPAPGRCGRPR